MSLKKSATFDIIFEFSIMSKKNTPRPDGLADSTNKDFFNEDQGKYL